MDVTQPRSGRLSHNTSLSRSYVHAILFSNSRKVQTSRIWVGSKIPGTFEIKTQDNGDLYGSKLKRRTMAFGGVLGQTQNASRRSAEKQNEGQWEPRPRKGSWSATFPIVRSAFSITKKTNKCRFRGRFPLSFVLNQARKRGEGVKKYRRRFPLC